MNALIALLPPVLFSFGNIIESGMANRLMKTTLSLFFYMAITNVLALPFLFIFDTPIIPDLQTLALLFLTQFLRLGMVLAYFKAMKFMDASIVQAIWGIGAIFLVTGDWIVFGVVPSLVAFFGFAIIMLSSLILSIDDLQKFKINKGFYFIILTTLFWCIWMLLSKQIIMDIGWVSVSFWTAIAQTVLMLSVLLASRGRKLIAGDWGIYKKSFWLFIAAEFIGSAANFSEKYAISMVPLYMKDFRTAR